MSPKIRCLQRRVFVSWALKLQHVFVWTQFSSLASIAHAVIFSLKLLFDIQERKVISHPSVSLFKCPMSDENWVPTWGFPWVTFCHNSADQPRNKVVFSVMCTRPVVSLFEGGIHTHTVSSTQTSCQGYSFNFFLPACEFSNMPSDSHVIYNYDVALRMYRISAINAVFHLFTSWIISFADKWDLVISSLIT